LIAPTLVLTITNPHLEGRGHCAAPLAFLFGDYMSDLEPTRIEYNLLPEEVDAIMFALNFYTDTVKQAHDCEDTSVWWEKRLDFFEGIGIELGLKLKRMTGRDSFSALKERLAYAWQVQHDAHLASLEEGDDNV